jgi:flagellar biosynthesis protein
MAAKNLPTSDPVYSMPKRRYATALGYDPNQDAAPKVLASGRGVIAEQILAVAQAIGIPIREDPLLAEALSRVEIDHMIPEELYELVAEVLAYIYRLRGKTIP